NFFQTVVRLVAPDLTPLQTTLQQIGPGQYAGSLRADQQGAYLVRVAQTRPGASSASPTLGLASPAAEESRSLGLDRHALAGYARAGSGRQLSTQSLADVWRHDIRADAFPTPIWPWLLVLAIILIPLDIGVRPVGPPRSDPRRAAAWIGRRAGLGEP